MALVKRTRREALVLCKELWTEIRDKDLTNKKRASIWEKVKTNPYDCQACFACEYDDTHTRRYCVSGGCILANIWPKGCAGVNNPYNDWFIIAYPGNTPVTVKARFNAADAIVKGCDEALAALDKKRK